MQSTLAGIAVCAILSIALAKNNLIFYEIKELFVFGELFQNTYEIFSVNF